MSIEDKFDDMIGGFDLIDRFQSWLTFAVAPVSRRAKHGRLDLVSYKIPRGDKAGVQSGNEVRAYLRRFGVKASFTGFDSETIWMDVRRNQQKWADTLLNVDADGIPQLDYGRKNWKEKAEARAAAQLRRSRRENASWLENWKSLFD